VLDFRAILSCFKAQDLHCLKSSERTAKEKSDFWLENRFQEPTIRKERESDKQCAMAENQDFSSWQQKQ